MWRGLLLVVALMTILLPLSDGVKRCNSQPNSPGVCSLKPEKGRCRAYIQRYYYNSRTGRCQTFIYGGCGGNANNFHTLCQCKKKCISGHNAGTSCPVPGQIFSTCARQCGNTCDQLRKRLRCIAVCKPGCDCPKGQVVDTRINKCVPTSRCPKSKPGHCPRRWELVKLQLSLQPPHHSRCRNDYQCPGKKKCCGSRRGRKSCVTPVRRRWRRRRRRRG